MKKPIQRTSLLLAKIGMTGAFPLLGLARLLWSPTNGAWMWAFCGFLACGALMLQFLIVVVWTEF